MNDNEIVMMFWDRDESALGMVSEKFGSYCRRIAFNILDNAEDSEECVNEAMLKAWESIPPNKPQSLSGFLGKLTRNLAIDTLRKRKSGKRGGGEYALVLEELSECVSDGADIGETVEYRELVDAINEFLRGLDPIRRSICVMRYSRLEAVEEIAKALGVKESYVQTVLFRTRKKLRNYLRKRGFEV